MPIWMQTSTGQPLDLAAPDLARLDLWADIAMPLAGLARFNGHSGALRDGGLACIYSVAQHCVVGANALLEETGSTATALAFLVHDAHEALIGDITTPATEMLEAALGTVIRAVFGEEASNACQRRLGAAPLAIAIKGSKRTLDRQIRRISGLPERLPEGMLAAVREMDARMLDFERRQLLGEVVAEPFDRIWPDAVLNSRPVRHRGPLRPWRRTYAASEWMRAFDAWRIRQAASDPITPCPAWA